MKIVNGKTTLTTGALLGALMAVTGCTGPAGDCQAAGDCAEGELCVIGEDGAGTCQGEEGDGDGDPDPDDPLGACGFSAS